MAQLVKNLHAVQEPWVQSLLGRSTGEGNGNPLQYSCLGNPTDREAWWATFQGVSRVGHVLATKPPPPHRFMVSVKYISIEKSLRAFPVM